VIGLVIVAFLFAQLGGNDKSSTSTTDTTLGSSTSTSVATTPATAGYGTTPCPAVDGSSPKTIDFSDQPMNCLDTSKHYAAVFDTSEGQVTVDLDPSVAPGAVNDFIVLARYHYYDGTKIFRSNTSIGILQGGSPHTQDNSDPGPGFPIEDEGGVFDYNATPATGPFTYTAGDLVLARTASPNGSGPQFFFGVNDSVANLDNSGTYIPLGHTSGGQDVLTAILALHQDTDSSTPGEGAPSKDVTINTVTIQES
jgi:cyclophilin family peptidyl-prolyl cis-trans isomerase